MSFRAKLSRAILFIYFLLLLLAWKFIPYLVDGFAVLSILVALPEIRKTRFRIKIAPIAVVICSFVLSAFASMNFDNMLFIVRFILHAIAIYLFLSISKRENLLKILFASQFLMIFVASLSSAYLKIFGPPDVYPLGEGIFSGGPNHFAYFLVGNLVLIQSYLRLSFGWRILTFLLTGVAVVLAGSATGTVALVIVLLASIFLRFTQLLLHGSIRTPRFPQFPSIIFILLTVSAMTSIFLLSDESPTKAVTAAFSQLRYRLINISQDESWRIRMQLFKMYNNAVQGFGLREILFGTGNFVTYKEHPYENSYYAAFLGGGVLALIALAFAISLNLIKMNTLENLFFGIKILLVWMIFSITANVLFEIQNLYPTLLLLSGAIIKKRYSGQGIKRQGGSNVFPACP